MNMFKCKKIVLYLFVFSVFILIISILFIYYTITHRTKGEYFDLEGIKIHYTDEGHGEPIILIHGFAVNADLNWRRPGIIDSLKPNFRIIAVDLRGHGLSSKPHTSDEYGIKMVKDIINLMDYIKIDKAHIVGYSLGGFIAIKLTTLYPDRVISLSPLGSGWELPEQNHFFSAIDKLIKKLENNSGIEPVSTHLDTSRRKPGIVHSLWVKILTRFFNDPKALIDVLKGVPELKVNEDEIKKINIPTCMVVGEHDPLRKGAENLKNVLPQSELTIIKGKDHITAPLSSQFKETLKLFLLKHSTNP
ncbi:MAG TPA: alpha/beta hydrolase [Candidatus Hydrogenedens sp.]|nr:alpha/beta hydrolase [Candidatus Hydrogenedens sp.]HOL21138.1 alpha/beta hydrolase [Candidatus Hydrogenedens sp.]HPP59013.1 alpha/beta hydrolase [Candidatus Hydrogenedens sp.]